MAKQSVAEDKSEAREPRGRVTQRTGKTRVVTAGEPGTPPAAPAESRARVEAKPEPAGRPDRASRAERPERAERTERAEKPERAEKSDRAERPERNERADSRDERREDGRGEQGAASGQPRYEQARQERFDRAQGSQGGSPGGPSGERGSFERGPTDRAERGGGGGGGGGGGDRGFDRPDRPQGQGYPGAQGGHGGPGGGGGGGGGEYRDRFQDRRDFNDSFGRRKRKKKRRGGGGDFHAPWGQRPSDFMLPSDEELEREAAEIEKAVAKGAVEAAKGGWTISALQKMDIEKLHKVAEEAGLEDFYQVPKQELVFKILKAKAASQGLMMGEGTLEVMPDKFGFLRSPIQSYLSGPDDIYVSPTQIRRYGLKKGMVVKGLIRPPKESERYFALLRVDEVNGRDPKAIHNLSNFEDLTPLHPEQRYILETTPNEIEMRIVDLVAPIGKGQRALIVAPPRTGKTVLMQKMTKAISTNFPDAKIFVLLVDERPEEVTDFRRNCAGPNIEVVASTFDEQSARHLQVAEMVIEKARRMVEFGEDVVILLDSITRLARAYNTEMPHSGKIGTGGIDVGALQRPKKFFGSARAIENGGSLTIIGTALVDTGSKADEVIFEEFKGTGNSELHLDRKLVEKRIYPAIDVAASGTRREELLMDKKELELVYRLRKVLSDMNVVEAMELMKARLGKVKTNAEFLMTMNMG